MGRPGQVGQGYPVMDGTVFDRRSGSRTDEYVRKRGAPVMARGGAATSLCTRKSVAVTRRPLRVVSDLKEV